jgi:hypothetical protein
METKMTMDKLLCSNKTGLAEKQQRNNAGKPWQLKWGYCNEITHVTKLQV